MISWGKKADDGETPTTDSSVFKGERCLLKYQDVLDQTKECRRETKELAIADK